ncbi:glycoside hydrolase family 78 protein [Periconia macrospinosa]|uniref:alpha-L-rhamnosidase n=1 Tax=Periconia macrospinosa TaxID=97972 RepID=A0A2V1DQ51_9PLEO|nr:glycoside hydrolase family 78 protein [Periconia macrospinosa]
MAVSISHVSFEHHRPAFGIGETTPRISWRFGGTAVDWEQTGYDLEIKRGPDGVPKVFNVDSSDSILVPWPDEPLGSAESASVRARAHGKDGQPSADWSDTYTVETGLLRSEDWAGAIPIAADRDTEVDAAHQPILFRKAFDVNSTVTSARLYITAFGLYVAEINGKRVGDHVLAPGYQAYNFRHVYDTYDVTDLIQGGANVLGATVGEGCKPRNLYGDTLGLQSLLVITAQDGSKQTIKSDLDWHANTGPIITSNIYDGELYDATKEIKGWSSPGLNESSWLGVKELSPPAGVSIVSPDGPPIKRTEEVKIKEIFQSKSGKTIIDFGQNLVGWLKVTVNGPAGTNISFVHAEVMDNGEIGTRPLRTAKATDTLILSGNTTKTWEPSFTFHGFRYVQVTGWPSTTPLDADSVTAVVVHSDMERTGYFECSHELLSKFHENVIWGLKGNFLSVPTDCPQRDERLGWTGDAHAFMPTSNYLYDTSGFWRGWLKDASFEQFRNGLNIPPVYIPSDDPSDTERDRVRFPTAIWGDVVVGNPYALYQSTGDKVMLNDQFPGAQAWIDKGIPRNENGLWDRSKTQFGDWLDPKAPPEDAGAATTSKSLVADAYLIQMTRLLSELSAALNKPDLATQYATQRETLIKAFQAAWITPYPIIANETQTALALALHFDLYTDAAARATASSTLRSIIANNTYLVGTGFAGTQQLGFALTDINATSDFYKMLLQTTVPSWLYQVSMGGTTTWERWDSMLPDGNVNPGEMTSFNHYAFGSVADWVHQKVGGLAIGEPGWKTVKVAPEPGGGITWAKARYLSPYGEVRSSWTVGDDGFRLEVSVPPNAKAEVTLPGRNETETVGSGTRSFFVEGYKIPG